MNNQEELYEEHEEEQQAELTINEYDFWFINIKEYEE